MTVEIENMTGPTLDELIEAEIFNALPLSDEEWELCKATYVITQGPQVILQLPRMVKEAFTEPDPTTRLTFRLRWPNDYTMSRQLWNTSSAVLVEKMRDNGWLFDLSDYEASDGTIIKLAGFQRLSVRGEAIGQTDALAIARAALIAAREWKKYEAANEAAKELANTL